MFKLPETKEEALTRLNQLHLDVQRISEQLTSWTPETTKKGVADFDSWRNGAKKVLQFKKEEIAKIKQWLGDNDKSRTRRYTNKPRR